VRAFAQPGHWLGPVTGPGWLGLAQPKKIKKIGNKKYKNIYKKKICMHIFKFKFIWFI
jgi:hypothetical protein